MLRVLRDGALQASIGAGGVARALRFTWDVTANEVLRVYDEVVRASVIPCSPVSLQRSPFVTLYREAVTCGYDR